MADNANQADRGGQPAAHDPGKSSVLADLLAAVTHQPPPSPPAASQSQTQEFSRVECEPGILAELLGLFSESSHDQGDKEGVPAAEKSPGFVERELERRRSNENGGSDSSNLERARILPIEEREKLEIEREGPSRGR